MGATLIRQTDEPCFQLTLKYVLTDLIINGQPYVEVETDPKRIKETSEIISLRPHKEVATCGYSLLAVGTALHSEPQ